MPASLEDLRAALAARYEIERQIGQGGMATVYLADDVRHQRKVAVKVLRPDLAAALGGERFLREIRIAVNLTHPLDTDWIGTLTRRQVGSNDGPPTAST